MVLTGWVFQDKAKIQECLVHDFSELIRIAGLKHELDSQLASSAAAGKEFVGYWGIVSGWQVTTRYDAPKTQIEAESIFEAVTHNQYGVLTWIRNFW